MTARRPIPERIGQITKDVPLPVVRSGTAYPLADLAVGESFPVRTTGTKNAKALQLRVSNAATYLAKKTGRKFVTRITGSTVRVWRIE